MLRRPASRRSLAGDVGNAATRPSRSARRSSKPRNSAASASEKLLQRSAMVSPSIDRRSRHQSSRRLTGPCTICSPGSIAAPIQPTVGPASSRPLDQIDDMRKNTKSPLGRLVHRPLNFCHSGGFRRNIAVLGMPNAGNYVFKFDGSSLRFALVALVRFGEQLVS
jgi:hypothetical protein